jgi:tripartite-type tricarboxylate transporter receptor subunit TctC
VVLKLHKAVVAAANDPGVTKPFTENGADMIPSATPEEFSDVIRTELRKWAKLVKDASITPE